MASRARYRASISFKSELRACVGQFSSRVWFCLCKLKRCCGTEPLDRLAYGPGQEWDRFVYTVLESAVGIDAMGIISLLSSTEVLDTANQVLKRAVFSAPGCRESICLVAGSLVVNFSIPGNHRSNSPCVLRGVSLQSYGFWRGSLSPAMGKYFLSPLNVALMPLKSRPRTA